MVISEQMTAEEFHRLNASAAGIKRPAWATDVDADPDNEMLAATAQPPQTTNAGAASSADAYADNLHDATAQQPQADSGRPVAGSRVLTVAELQALAKRRGLDFERLLSDAKSKGVVVEPTGVV